MVFYVFLGLIDPDTYLLFLFHNLKFYFSLPPLLVLCG